MNDTATMPAVEAMSRDAFSRRAPSEQQALSARIRAGTLTLTDTPEPYVHPGAVLVDGFPRRQVGAGAVTYAVAAQVGEHHVVVDHAPDLPEAALAIPKRAVHRVIEALCVVDANRRALAAEPDLSDRDKDVRLAPALGHLSGALKTAEAELDESQATIDAAFARAYAAPTIEKDDYVSGLMDRERRDVLRAAGARAAKIIAQEPTMATALLRAPETFAAFEVNGKPINLKAEAERSWRAYVDRTDPNIERLRAGEKGLAWGRRAIAHAYPIK
jgi:hypothetical protein